jgi:hypothetical protein
MECIVSISIEEISGVSANSRVSQASKIQALINYLNRPDTSNTAAETSNSPQALGDCVSCEAGVDESPAGDSASTLSAADIADHYDAIQQQMLGSKSAKDVKSSALDSAASSPIERIDKLLSQLKQLLADPQAPQSSTSESTPGLNAAHELNQENPSDSMNVQKLQELLRLLAGNQKPPPLANSSAAGSCASDSAAPSVNASTVTGSAGINSNSLDLKNVLSSLEKLLAGVTAEKASPAQASGTDLHGANSFTPMDSSISGNNTAAPDAGIPHNDQTNQADSEELEKLLEFLRETLFGQKAPQQQPIVSSPSANGSNFNSAIGTSKPAADNPASASAAAPKPSSAATPEALNSAKQSNLAEFYEGGTPGPKDQWGDSQNVNKPAVFNAVFQSVKDNWDTGAIPQNVKDLFSSSKTDAYFEGLNLSSDAKTKAQQKATIWELATASHETGNSYDPSKLPSYWEAGGSGTHAGQTQTAGMIADPKGMTYGMFSTESTKPIDVADPRKAVVADLQKFGQRYAEQHEDLQATLKFIGQTDSTSVIPSIKQHGASYLESFEA